MLVFSQQDVVVNRPAARSRGHVDVAREGEAHWRRLRWIFGFLLRVEAPQAEERPDRTPLGYAAFAGPGEGRRNVLRFSPV